MSISTTGSKRKADSLGGGRPAVIARLKDAKSVSDPTSGGTPHIPPPVWGHVLDYMPYEEVRSALLVGKIIASEAVKYVRTLNFMKGYQLDVPSARRFPGVEEVNCLSLISSEESAIIMCKDTAIRLVPLLETYSKLNSVFVGGLLKVQAEPERLIRDTYYSRVCSSPNNHRDLFKALSLNLLGAFKARSLPPSIAKVDGILGGMYGAGLCSGGESEEMCESCKEICSYFPPHDIIEHSYFSSCVEGIDVLETIVEREGARKIFRTQSSVELCRFLGPRLYGFRVGESNESNHHEAKEQETLKQRLEDLGVAPEAQIVNYLQNSTLTDLDRMIAVGFDPSAVSKKDLYTATSIIVRDDQLFANVFARSTFDALVARGFALDEDDFIVLDERTEPALKGLSSRIRDEED